MAFIQKSLGPDTVAQYAIYRSENGNPYSFIAYSEEEEFFDNSVICQDYYLVCYYVTAIYSSQMDWCESNASNVACDICPIGIQEEQISRVLEIYPNPASEVIFIESSEKLESVSIFDSRGCQVVGWSGGQVVGWSGGQEKVGIPLDGLAPGLYLVRVETGGAILAKKVVVRR